MLRAWALMRSARPSKTASTRRARSVCRLAQPIVLPPAHVPATPGSPAAVAVQMWRSAITGAHLSPFRLPSFPITGPRLTRLRH
jgi:hypothetical protein